MKLLVVFSLAKIIKCVATYLHGYKILTFFLNSCKMLSIFAVMNTIGRHIKYLIRYNDCVIVPGWGAFIAQYQSATFDSNKITPPIRTIAFNASLTHDDGLLASSISRQLGISYDCASKRIAEDVNAMKYQLKNTGEVALSNIGSFVQNVKDSTVLFEPYNNNSAIAPYYGLPSISITPIVKSIVKEKQDGDTIYLPIRKNWMRIAASIVVILGLGIMFSTPIINNQVIQASLSASIVVPQNQIIKLNEPSLNERFVLNVSNIDAVDAKELVDTLERSKYQTAIAKRKEQENQKATVLVGIVGCQKKHEKKSFEEVSPLQQNDVILSKNNALINSTANADADKYCLVVASLPSRKLAEDYISKSSESNLSILEKDGRFRIYALTGETVSQTMSQAKMTGLMSRYPKAWVCRK